MEYHDCIALAKALGKTHDEAIADWNAVNSMKPAWCNIIKNYPCTCDGLSQLRTEIKGREVQPEQGISG